MCSQTAELADAKLMHTFVCDLAYGSHAMWHVHDEPRDDRAHPVADSLEATGARA